MNVYTSSLAPGMVRLLPAMLLLAALARAQQLEVVLANGSVFKGRVVEEGDHFLFLELEQGKIKLDKRRIVARFGEKKPEPIDPEPTSLPDPKPPDEGKGSGVQRLIGLLRGNIIKGAGAGGRVLASPEDTPAGVPTPGSDLEVVELFFQLIQRGESELALDHCVDFDLLLDRSFPGHARGLTLYSRTLALRSFATTMETMLALPDCQHLYEGATFEAEMVTAGPLQSVVELKVIWRDGRTTRHLLLVSQRRIADFAAALPPLSSMVSAVYKELGSMRDGPWSLVPALETVCDAVAEQLNPGHDSPIVPVAARLRGRALQRPKGRYRLTLPKGWRQLRSQGKPREADILVGNGAAYAMVLYEDSDLPLAEVRRAVMRNLERISEGVRIGAERRIRLGEVEGQQFHVEASIGGLPFIYLYVIFQESGRTYQIIWWTLEDHYRVELPAFEQITTSFRTTP